MATCYQLFDLESGNLIAEFAQEQDAWEALRSLPPDDLTRLGLVRMDGEDVTLAAMDDGLIREVLANVVPFIPPAPIKQEA